VEEGQRFGFGFADTLVAEIAGVPLDALHHDIDAICRGYDMLGDVADRLGVECPPPRLAGFAYNHISALGAEVVFAEGSEPNVNPIIHDPRDIDLLREPEDYLSAGVVVGERLRALETLLDRRPDAVKSIGHELEGPITTAVLLMGQNFFTLPYDDPERAHRLLSFCVESASNYTRAIRERLGRSLKPELVGLPDDFAGMFPPAVFEEFVVPYWDGLYGNLEATERYLHSELLRIEHLDFLKELRIAVFDPSADQYVTPASLREHCPTPFTSRILAWDIRERSAAGLQSYYREIAEFRPVSINFYMTSLQQEEKFAALLEVARELAPAEA